MIPLPLQTNGRVYAIVFLVFLFCWPLLFFTGLFNIERHPPDPTVKVCTLIPLMIGSYILNYRRCSSDQLSYWGGLCLIAGVWRSGCVQITALMILPLLALFHTSMCVISTISFFTGKSTAEAALIRICHWFARDSQIWEDTEFH
jgi:hypothetical protein